MDRIWESGASASPPTAPASPSSGYPIAGNPAAGTPATTPGPWWYHMVTEEMRAVIAAAGLTPDHTNLGQLLSALQAMGLRDATETLKGRVELATSAEVMAGTDAVRAVTPAGVFAAFRQFGLGAASDNVPVLSDFNNPGLKTGFYKAYGKGNAAPTPNAPAGTANTILSVYAVQLSGAVHYLVKENSASNDGQRLYIGNAYNGTSVQWTEIPNIGAFAASKAQIGWQKLPSGLIIQWGQAPATLPGYSITVTLPIAFPTACASVLANLINETANANGAHSIYVSGFTPTSFVLGHDDTAAESRSLAASWIAIGY